jgi:hypothetical protein
MAQQHHYVLQPPRLMRIKSQKLDMVVVDREDPG